MAKPIIKALIKRSLFLDKENGHSNKNGRRIALHYVLLIRRSTWTDTSGKQRGEIASVAKLTREDDSLN
ncbi:hypothetical protein [Nostoc sp. NMS4]|uniref:hypothetical protein n=1 Tax=Nostoc sp. NMS4 TaxID=2815390 RepID=UPI0025DB8B92|nr:hypothetical protein [Nostoc sp. NMS4]MBN3921717.1 hypothetical protein [Nostoc sp. NMS4]